MSTIAASPAMAKVVIPDTHQKALALNLDPTSFGSFAEIGAGQEVARWFLRVGAASGTVAKTISAYDKEVSDDLYGAGTRYVSKPRLVAMLEGEWKSLLRQVGEARSGTTRFFSYANTIAARNFAGTNDCHGWMGVRFQHRPGATPSEILLHVNLRDAANVLQQEAVGILGVNLLYALLAKPEINCADIRAMLFDNLAGDRIEIDQIEMQGEAFTGQNMKNLHIGLAQAGQAEAITFSSEGVAVAANEFLYKRAVVIAPSGGDQRDTMPQESLASSVDSLRREATGDPNVRDIIGVRLFHVSANSPAIALQGAGPMLVTQHQQLYRVTEFIRRYTQAPLRFALTLPAVMRIFDDVRYQNLEGRMLEGLARLFAHNVRILAFPARSEDMERVIQEEWQIDLRDDWIAADQVRPPAPMRHLYDYLLGTRFLVPMTAADPVPAERQ